MNEPAKQQINQSSSQQDSRPVDRQGGRQQPAIHLYLLIFVLLIAFLLRTDRLSEIPSCLDYDEASNVILMGEISRGEQFPIFIRPYNGKEVLFFYLVAGMMKLAGVTPFTLRLASAFCGVINVALTYFFVQELFATAVTERDKRRWLGLFSAALVTICYWQVNLSRFGYRTIVMPPVMALAGGFWLRALRVEKWRWMALAGALTGLAAYTYFSVRVWPVLLLFLWGWVLIADRRRWWLRLRQLLLFGLAALIVFAPLGIYFLRNPEMLFVRMDQVSVFSPAVNRGDLWGTLTRTLRLAFGMFTVAGDLNPIYNFPGKPVFDRFLGLFFYLGLLICAVRMVWPSNAQVSLSRFPYFLLLAWLPIMMIPNVLSASGVPHNVRAMSLLPAVFIVPAVGITTAIEWSEKALFRRGTAIFRAVLLIVLLLMEGGFTFHDYFNVWARSAAPYYKGHEFLIRAAELINAHPEADPYVATYFLQHPTVAVHARDYLGIRWIGGKTLVLPPPSARPALLIYDYDNPVDPLLRERYLDSAPLYGAPLYGAPSSGALFHRELGPDGGVAFEAFLLTADNRPLPAPQHPADGKSHPLVNLGNTLAFLGYDLNAPAVSGEVLDITLYFEVLRAVDRDDFAFFAHLVDAGSETNRQGFRWGGETFFNYPSLQWRPGEVMLFHKKIAIEPGAPPGSYKLNVGVYSASLDARLPVLNAAGQMVGTAFQIGPVKVAAAAQPPAELPSIQQPMQAIFEGRGGEDNRVSFLGFDRDRGDLRPGETLALTLYWQLLPDVEEDQAAVFAAQVSVWLSGPGGEVSLWSGHPVQGAYPFSQWPPNAFVRDRYALRLPADTPAGDYDLRLALLDAGGNPLPVDGAESLSLSTIHVHATDKLWEPPAFDHPVGARLGSAQSPSVELLGYTLDREQAKPGETIHLTLVWQCLEEMDTAYTVFTHLLDAGQQMRGQKDNPPKNGAYPTTLWAAGEIVVDEYDIVVKPDTPPCTHVVEVGMYDSNNLSRLPVFDPTGAIGDRILLGAIEIGQ